MPKIVGVSILREELQFFPPIYHNENVNINTLIKYMYNVNELHLTSVLYLEYYLLAQKIQHTR